MPDSLMLVSIVIGLTLLFDFLNGFHDAANAIATIVVTRTLTPLQAVILAACGNFIGYFSSNVAVAKAIGKGVINLESITLTIILAALIGAILWNILTWLLGLPTSSSHALIGGLIGSGIAAVGFDVVLLGGVIKIISFIVLAPLLGMIGAMIFTYIIIWLFRKSNHKNTANIFKKLQLVSASFYSYGHGTNDAQKCMGIIAMALVAGGVNKDFHVDNWVAFSCQAAIALGTAFGGWRIVKTMGTKITKIHAMEGFCAESSSALVLLMTAHFGIPVSTTHVISGSIMGVGAVENATKVRWATARRIVWAWILTIPSTAACAALSYHLISLVS